MDERFKSSCAYDTICAGGVGRFAQENVTNDYDDV